MHFLLSFQNKFSLILYKLTNLTNISAHPRFFNQLFGGMDQFALGGAWLTEALNESQ